MNVPQVVNDIVQRSIELVNAHKHNSLTATEAHLNMLELQYDLRKARELGKSVITIHAVCPDGRVRLIHPSKLPYLFK